MNRPNVRAIVLAFALVVSGSPVLLLQPSSSADSAKPQEQPSVAELLQAMSVTVKADQAHGSGVLRQTKDKQVWVLTAGHVVNGLRSADGSFQDAQVYTWHIKDGIKDEEIRLNAEVVRYSRFEKEDLALLRIKSPFFQAPGSVVFCLDPRPIRVGTELYVAGSPLNPDLGGKAVSVGIFSLRGHILWGKEFDQTSVPVEPGNSGGPVVLKGDGRCVGLLTLMSQNGSFSLYVPVRRLQAWAKRVGVDFVLDDRLPVPSEEELRKAGIEEKE